MSGSGFLPPGAIGPVALGGGIGVPADPVPVAGAELLTNGNFAAWTGGNPDGYTLFGTESPPGTEISESPAGAARIVGGSAIGIYQSVATAYGWMQYSIDVVAYVSGWLRIFSGGYSARRDVINALGTWSGVELWPNNTTIGIGRSSGGDDVSVDNFSAKLLTLSSLLSTQPYASADCDLSAAVTRTAGTQAGFAMRVDDPANPQNFIIAYETGAGRVKIDKCVAGVYTNVLDAAITYVAGQNLRGVCSGNNVSIYYNGVQVGTTQTVSDAGIVSNTRHGKFSTYANNTLANYVAA